MLIPFTVVEGPFTCWDKTTLCWQYVGDSKLYTLQTVARTKSVVWTRWYASVQMLVKALRCWISAPAPLTFGAFWHLEVRASSMLWHCCHFSPPDLCCCLATRACCHPRRHHQASHCLPCIAPGTCWWRGCSGCTCPPSPCWTIPPRMGFLGFSPRSWPHDMRWCCSSCCSFP